MANKILDTVGKGLNSAKEGIESVSPSIKNFDTQVGKVIDSKVNPALQKATGAVDKVKTSATKGADAVGTVAKALDPSKALKNFDASQGTASIGANVANGVGNATNKILRPADKSKK